MITNKNALNQSAIIDWVYRNTYIFSDFQVNIKKNTKQAKDNYGKALSSLRKYLNLRLKSIHQGIKLDKIGIIYCKQSSSSKTNKKTIITRIRYSSDLLLQFSQIEPHQHGQLKYEQLNYEEIAGHMFLDIDFVKFAINSYFNACLQLAILEQDRKVIIDLGVVNIEILGRKARLRQVTPISDNKQNISYVWQMLQKNQIAQQVWKQSLQGTLYQHLNIKTIKNNFDKGAATTYKYNQMIQKKYF